MYLFTIKKIILIYPIISGYFKLFFIIPATAKHTDLEYCFPNPCRNGGSCFSTHDGFKCLCMQGYKGDTCEGKNVNMANNKVMSIIFA